MFTGGTVPITKPAQCAKHGLPYVRSIDGDGIREIWTCAACNADVIDGWAKQPGTISIKVGR